MRAISILIADDHPIVLRGLRTLLETERNWQVIAEAMNGREAVAQAMQLQPDVAILDVSMPELNGLAASRRIANALPQTRILIITMRHDWGLIAEVLKAGAHGYMLKSDAERDLVTAVRSLSQNGTFFTGATSEVILERARGINHNAPQALLSIRETEILQLLVEGKSNKQVAVILGISTRTVETHRAHVMHKLGLRSFSELVRYAIRNKIVET